MLQHLRKWWHPATSGLKSLSIGSLELTPEFSSATKEYTTTTNNDKDKVTVESLDAKDKVTIKVNGTTLKNGNDATWTKDDDNEVKVTVKDSYSGTDIVYTVTVTHETPTSEG